MNSNIHSREVEKNWQASIASGTYRPEGKYDLRGELIPGAQLTQAHNLFTKLLNIVAVIGLIVAAFILMTWLGIL